MSQEPGGGDRLTPEQSRWMDRVRAADSLAGLQDQTGADSAHDAYLAAKPRWKRLRRLEGHDDRTGTFPGDSVGVGDRTFHVHGVTHADTDAERTYLREKTTALLDEGATVFCEQGIRPMYFDDFRPVREIDDYRWAMHHCRQRGISSHIDGIIQDTFEESSGVAGNIVAAASQLRDVTFSLIGSGSEIYGQTFASALGDVASSFLMDHEHLATAEDFESFERSKVAAENPSELASLQRYYDTVFLPQPIEREWLRRHDPELELFTHARNERMAEYVLYNAPETAPVHLVVGAAHQSGVAYYLSAYDENEWDYGTFEVVP